jgi:hypothetical protein
MTAVAGGFAGLSYRFRAARDVRLRALIMAERQRVSGPFRILDVGGRADYWQRVGLDFLEAQDVEILCVNYTEAELYAGAAAFPRLKMAVGDARALDFADGSFHLVHSNSVIEHVGGFADKRAFAGEVRRLAPAYYVQTPYFWFPIDPHWPKMPLFHWMPMSWRWRLLCRWKLGFAGPHRSMDHALGDLEATVLLDWAQMRRLFPDAELRAERLAGLPKSVIAERRSA